MKNISKLLVGILFSALAIAPTYAGELTVTGGATATYAIQGDDSGSGKSLGISNELDFSASGELDNGYTHKGLGGITHLQFLNLMQITHIMTQVKKFLLVVILVQIQL